MRRAGMSHEEGEGEGGPGSGVVCDGDVCWAPNSTQPAKRDYAALVRCAARPLSVIRDGCITTRYINFISFHLHHDGKGRLLRQHTADIHRREQDNAIDATMVEHFTCQFVAFVSLMWAEYLGTDWDRTDEMVRANALRKEMFCPASKDKGDAVKPSASAPNVEAVAGTCAPRGRPRGWANDVTYCIPHCCRPAAGVHGQRRGGARAGPGAAGHVSRPLLRVMPRAAAPVCHGRSGVCLVSATYGWRAPLDPRGDATITSLLRRSLRGRLGARWSTGASTRG
jgi:hypothetical protein